MSFRKLLPVLALAVAPSFACTAPADDVSDEDDITSNEDGFVDFDFDASVLAGKDDDVRKAVVAQLFYTVGPLTTQYDANGQVGQAKLTNVKTTAEAGGKRISYHAKFPVAWPKSRKIPKSYELVLPKDARALDAFNAKYDGKCGKDEYGQSTFWHDFNPKADGCAVAGADAVRATVKISKTKNVTSGKYPEYDKVWADGALEIVAIFGESDGGAEGDAGVGQYESFVGAMTAAIPGAKTVTNATTPSLVKDVSISGTVRALGGDKPVRVTALLVDTLYQTAHDFDERYDAASATADVVVYNGHSELSKNTNALAAKGTVAKGKYQIFFFDSCDTYAYLDTALFDRRRQINGATADPNGTKYLDTLTNVLPSYFSNYANSSMTLVRALLTPDSPKSYNQILDDMPADQVVVVAGEDDNAYHP